MSSSINAQVADKEKTIRQMIRSAVADLWVMMPCIVESYDPEAVTITAQPCLLIPVRQPDGSLVAESLPLLVDVPVMFMRGGGVAITHPIKKGDECIVQFADRSIDGWYQSGGQQVTNDGRMHDLSDGFAFFAPMSQASKLTDIDPDRLHIRTDDGLASIALDPSDHAVTVETVGPVDITAPSIKLSGAVQIDGALTVNGDTETLGALTNNGKSVGGLHTHSMGGAGVPN